MDGKSIKTQPAVRCAIVIIISRIRKFIMFSLFGKAKKKKKNICNFCFPVLSSFSSRVSFSCWLLMLFVNGLLHSQRFTGQLNKRAAGKMSSIQQQRAVVEQLRREASIKRISVSQAIEDIKVWGRHLVFSLQLKISKKLISDGTLTVMIVVRKSNCGTGSFWVFSFLG